MKTYEAVIHYVVPSHCGGVKSAVQHLTIHDTTEEGAEQQAAIKGVNDPNYLYTNMIEVNLIAGI